MALCLSRKIGQSIQAGDVTFTIVEVRRGKVRVAIDAPSSVRILRDEMRAKHPRLVGGREAA